MEEMAPQKDGEHTYISVKFPLHDSEGHPYALCGISTDITARKRAEQTLKKTSDRVRDIIDTAHEAFISMDESGVITFWNRQAEETFGWPRSKAVGRLLRDTIIPPRYREAHQRGLEQFIATGQGPLLNKRIELEALHRDGRELPVELTISAMRTPNGYVFNAFLRDISERKRLPGELAARPG
jgi:PAS domain S-box-containing protein